jgi:hypothetical protein
LKKTRGQKSYASVPLAEIYITAGQKSVPLTEKYLIAGQQESKREHTGPHNQQIT